MPMMLSAPHRAWYVFRVPPKRERKAEALLRDKKFEVCVPVRQHGKRGKGRNRLRRIVTRLVVPRHVFVLLDRDDEAHGLQEVRKVELIRVVVGFNGRPVGANNPPGWIAEDVMERWLSDLGDPDPIAEPPTQMNPGMKVAVRVGPFAQLIGELADVQDGSAELLIELFNRPSRITVAIADLETIETAKQSAFNPINERNIACQIVNN